MKHLLLTTIAAVVLAGCGPSVDIHQAAEEGNIEAVKQHLADGVDVNAKDGDDDTPLDEAVSEGEKEIADLLRKHGGKNGNNWFGDDKAEKSKPLKNKVPDISIHDAATEGDIEIVKQHLAVGADVELKCVNCGGTVLGHAVSGGHIEIVELLISKSADVNTKFDDNGATPLHLAAVSGHKEIVELLIDAGAYANAKADGELTPLHFAADKGHKEVVELLIAKGADLNAKIESAGILKGYTPLDVAEEFNLPELASILRKHGGKTGEELKAECE